MSAEDGARDAAGGGRRGMVVAIAALHRLLALRRRPLALALVALAAALLAVGGVSLLPGGEPKGGARAVTAAVAGAGIYHELPEITADLKTSRPRLHYVQLAAVVEVAEENAAALQAQQTLIVADVQMALRDLSRQDLAGAAGIERLRALFTRIIERHIAPARVRSVLFTRFLVG